MSTFERYKRWTQKEIDYLVNTYPNPNVSVREMCDHIGNVTPDQVGRRARRLYLYRPTLHSKKRRGITGARGLWERADITDRLLELRGKPGIDARGIANQLNEEFGTSFTRSAVIGRLDRMGYAVRKDHPTPNGARDDLVPVPEPPPPPAVKRPAPAPGARICAIEGCRGPRQPGKPFCNACNPVPPARRADRVCAEIAR